MKGGGTPRRKAPPKKERATAGGALREYSAKRAFEATPEPAPAAAPDRSGPLLFVVQQHAARRLHFDFRLEAEGVLKSWAVPKGPSLNPADKRLAVPTEDHPFDYASFEGVIPEKQYGAGEVIVWDCGAYSPDEDSEYFFHDRAEAERRVLAGLAQGKLSFFLRGVKLKGSFALVRTSDRKSWLLIKHKDRFVDTGDVTADGESVLSGMAVEALKRRPARERVAAAALAPTGPPEPFPAKLSPMLAESGDASSDEPEWQYEPKLDGYRVLAFIDRERVMLRSRRGLDLSAVFPEVAAELGRQLVSTMVLDGEIVALGADGRPSFDALQDRAQLKTARELAAAEQATPTAYCLLRSTPLRRRQSAAGALRRAPPLPRAMPAAFAARAARSCRRRRPARCSPRRLPADSRGSWRSGAIAPICRAKRASHWRKIKSTQSAEFVVGGYTKGKGAREPLGALLLGALGGEGPAALRGHVGSGFDEATLAEVKRRADPLQTAK